LVKIGYNIQSQAVKKAVRVARIFIWKILFLHGKEKRGLDGWYSGGKVLQKAVIIMGSKSDLRWSERIAAALEGLGVGAVLRIASAHKAPMRCYEIIKK